MARARASSAPKTTDPLVGSREIADQLGASVDYAWRLMRAGEFGAMFDVGTGERRSRPRVRQSGVDGWIAGREIKRASA